jgi:hypothetical protein
MIAASREITYRIEVDQTSGRMLVVGRDVDGSAIVAAVTGEGYEVAP